MRFSRFMSLVTSLALLKLLLITKWYYRCNSIIYIIKTRMRSACAAVCAVSLQLDICRMRHLIMVCTVCLNYRKVRVKYNSLRPAPFSQPTLRDSPPTSAFIVLILLLLLLKLCFVGPVWHCEFLRVPTIYVLSRNMKNIRVFLSENFQFFVDGIFYIFEKACFRNVGSLLFLFVSW